MGPRRGDPDGGHGDVHDLLTAAVEEAARLLDADGAMVYLFDPTTNRLRFAHDAGIESQRSREWVRSIDLPVGVGMFGRAVAERAVVITGDYLEDRSFDHAAEPDRVVRDVGIKSMVVAPLTAGDDVFGALGTFSVRPDAFTPAQIGLVRALADHAGAAMRNVRLIEALDSSRRELARTCRRRTLAPRDRGEDQRRHRPRRGPPARRRRGRAAAPRGRREDRPDRPATPGSCAGHTRRARSAPMIRSGPTIPDETLDQGVSGQAVVRGRPFWTGDYANDRRFPHGQGADTYVDATQVRSAMAAPLTGETGPFGALTVFTARPDAWAETDASLLEAIADQAAIMIRTTRLIGELDARGGARAAGRTPSRRSARSPRGSRSCGTDRDPPGRRRAGRAAWSRRTGSSSICSIRRPATSTGRMDDGPGRAVHATKSGPSCGSRSGSGATGVAVAEDRVIVADDDLARPVPALPRVDRVLRTDGVPLDDRGADHRRVGAARCHRGLFETAGRLHRRTMPAWSAPWRARPRSRSRTPG